MKKYFFAAYLTFSCCLVCVPNAAAVEAKGLESNPIHAGDELNINIRPQESLSGSFTVDSFGKIHHPVLGEIFVESLTQGELEEYLTEDLGKGYENPQVEVQFADKTDKPEASVTVVGPVVKPGSYALTPGLTFLKVISKAGGFTPAALTQNVRIVRKTGEFKVMKVDADKIMAGQSPDILLEARDLILVKESGS